MAKCRECGGRITWIEVSDEGSPTGLIWRRFERAKGREIRRPHVCKKKESRPTVALDRRRMWWLND